MWQIPIESQEPVVYIPAAAQGVQLGHWTQEGQPTCQHIRAAHIDLGALAPAELDALPRSRRVQQQMNNALRSSAERELDRKRYTAVLAEWQFNRADPDNRLVTSELERRW